jgi:hypothetical protein
MIWGTVTLLSESLPHCDMNVRSAMAGVHASSLIPGELVTLFALLQSAQVGLKLADMDSIDKRRPVRYSPSNFQD